MRIDSAPQQAAVYLEDEKYGIVGYTPWDGRLGRGNWKVILKKDGYEVATRYMQVARKSRLQETFMPMVRANVPALVSVRADADPEIRGAEVWVDGQSMGSVPAQLKLREGRHLLEVKKAGRETFAQWVEVQAGEKLSVSPALRLEASSPEPASVPTPIAASLLVSSDVSGATVTIDGTPVGPVPHQAPTISPGTHVVTVTAPGFAPKSETVEVTPGVPVTVELNFGAPKGPNGVLRVEASEFGAQVEINGQALGAAPVTKALSVGQHEIVVTKPGFGRFVQTVDVTEGELRALRAALAKAAGLRLTSNPPGADVYLDGQHVGKTPFTSNELAAGTRFLALRLPGFRDHEQTLVLAPGQESEVDASLTAPEESQVSPMTPEDEDRLRKGLSSFGATALPKGRSTIDFGGGYPYYLDGQITVGVGKIADRYALDAGILLRSYLARTEIGLGSRITLLDKQPFSVGGFLQIGGGSNFIDDSARNTFFTNIGGAVSLAGLGAVTVTGRAWMNVYSDRHCPEVDEATMQFAERGVDPVDTCEQYLNGMLSDEDRRRVDEDLFDGANKLFERDNGVRFMASLLVEIAFREHWNLWFALEGAPFQGERAAFTDLFSGTMVGDDLTTYIRGGATYKF